MNTIDLYHLFGPISSSAFDEENKTIIHAFLVNRIYLTLTHLFIDELHPRESCIAPLSSNFNLFDIYSLFATFAEIKFIF